MKRLLALKVAAMASFLVASMWLLPPVGDARIHRAGVVGVDGDPASVRPVMGVLRNPGTGWVIYHSGHAVMGMGSVRCDSNGVLYLTLAPVGAIVGAMSVQPDETLSRRGVLAGVSAGPDEWRIWFTRITSAGVSPLDCSSPLLQGSNANLWVHGSTVMAR